MVIKTLHKSIVIGLLLTAGFIYNCAAANNGIALSLVNYTVQNDSGHVSLGYTITINALITNTDSLDFTGQLDFGLHNDQQQLSTTGIFNKPPYSGNQISLNPGETVPAVFSIDIETPYFLPGPDVVVVWPISASPIVDSIQINLNINNPNAISNVVEAQINYLILGNKIVLQGMDAETVVKQVRIYSITGQVIYSADGSQITEVPIGLLPKALYICELQTADNKRKVIKFVK
jgi:hypothetical protein